MATPAKSVQARSVEDVLALYDQMQVPSFAIRQGSAQNAKWIGESVEDGHANLKTCLEFLERAESAAIYTLCLFEDPPERVTDRTPCSLSLNFRLLDTPSGYISGEQYAGGYSRITMELQQLRKEIQEIRAEKEQGGGQLGLIGDLLSIEALQPVIAGLGMRLVDAVLPEKKVGQLERLSGVPGQWREDDQVTRSLDRLAAKVDNLGTLLGKLADMAERNPTVFQFYLKAFNRM